MELNSKDNMSKVKSMVREPLLGLMDPLTLVNSLKTIFKATASTTGLTEENSKDHG